MHLGNITYILLLVIILKFEKNYVIIIYKSYFFIHLHFNTSMLFDR